MCAFHPNAQSRLIDQGVDPVATLRSVIRKSTPWDSAVDFATHPSFCGSRLYPRQHTLLRLMFLETEQMTDYDLEVIEGWRQGFTRRRDVFGVQPDIWERIAYLKSRGARRFPHIQFIGGRRGSKGLMGGILGAEQLAYFHTLDDWQRHYGVDAGKDGYLNIGATSQTQAKDQLFADIRSTVERCQYLHPYIAETKDHILSVRTPADIRRIGEMKAAGVPIDHLVATLKVQALSSQSAAGRGATAFGIMLDEFAFMLQTGSAKSGDSIYEDWAPSLDQFDLDGLMYVPSSPYCLEPKTRVLTEDLRWVPVGSLNVGDRLIGFDEHPPKGRGQYRSWQPAVVTETSLIQAPRYEMTTESGKKIVCTGEHMWLAKRYGGMGNGNGRGLRAPGYPQKFCWIKTHDLMPGDSIKMLGVDPWETDDSRDGGYLAGLYDGEGCFTRGGSLGFAQNPGEVQEDFEKLMAERGFMIRTSGKAQGRSTLDSYLLGGFPEAMRFFGVIRPKRLLPKFISWLYGKRIYTPANSGVDKVVSVRRVDDGPVIALGTSTQTLVAEGLLSHNTRSGRCYSLYQQGSVLMSSYTDREGGGEEAAAELKKMAAEKGTELDEVHADPTMLIIHLPSWGAYMDWERGPELVGIKFKRAIQPGPDHESQRRRKLRNPEKYQVERAAQWSEVMGAYLDPDMVDKMFVPPTWRPPLQAQGRGYLDRKYRIHCDPGRTGANFALCIGHTEDFCPTCGWNPKVLGMALSAPERHPQTCPNPKTRPQVIIDLLHVWKPTDFPPDPETGKPTIDYVQVREDIEGLLKAFPSTTKVSFDQWNSSGLIAELRRKFSPTIRVAEVTFTEKENQSRCEKVKSALNLGWVSSYADTFGPDGSSLLEQEMKYLSVRAGKVIKQDIGPITTKDLFDAFAVVTTDLLHTELERHGSADGNLSMGVYGSSNVAALQSGREQARVPDDGSSRAAQNRARLAAFRDNRPRYEPSRLSSIRSRRG